MGYSKPYAMSAPWMPPQIDRETVSDIANQVDKEKLKWRSA